MIRAIRYGSTDGRTDANCRKSSLLKTNKKSRQKEVYSHIYSLYEINTFNKLYNNCTLV